MTTRINLLPWREELRRERKVRFLSILGISALAAVAMWWLVTLYFDQLIEYQNNRNKFLQNQISLLDEKIEEVRNLEKEKAKLLARMQAIETLQTSRPIIVHLFDELVTTLPDGVFLQEVSQKGQVITIRGVAQSNARVSNFMRNIEASRWVTNPQLNVIENRDEQGRRVANFTLRASQVLQQTSEDAEGEVL